MLVPFTSHEDHDFFQHLEMHMRAENPPICGRDHLSYRSYYYPVKNIIDGDLCEQFNTLDASKQKSISEELDRLPADVSKKLEDIRTRYAFWTTNHRNNKTILFTTQLYLILIVGRIMYSPKFSCASRINRLLPLLLWCHFAAVVREKKGGKYIRKQEVKALLVGVTLQLN